MTNEVSIVLRVNTSEASKLTSTFADVQRANAALEKDAAKRLAASRKLAAALDKEIAATADTGRAAQSAAVFLKAEVDQREQSLLTIQRSNALRLEEAEATQRSAAVMRKTALEDAASTRMRAENAAALQAFKIRTIGETVEAELAADAKLARIHAAAIAEDIAREKTRAAAILRERSKPGALASAGTGVLSVARVGFGTSAVGAGIGGAMAVVFASKTAIEFERATQAINAATGSLQQTGREMGFVDQQAQRLGLNVLNMASAWASFRASSKGTTLEGEKSRDIFLAVSEASQKLNLRSEESEGALRALAQMMSKGKVQAEELRGQLGDRLPGAFNIMARALGVSTAQLDKMLQNGQIMAEDALPKFAAELRRTFGTDANTQIETTTANFNRLGNEIRIAAGALGGFFNRAAGPSAAGIADTMRNIREASQFREQYGFLDQKKYAAEYIGPNDPRYFNPDDAAYRKRTQAFYTATATADGPTGRGGFDFTKGLGIPAPAANEALTGAGLLTSGQSPLSDKDRTRILTIAKQTLAVDKELTEEARVRERIENGEFEGRNKAVADAELELARAKDVAKTKKDAATAAKAAAREATSFREANEVYDRQQMLEETREAEAVKRGIREQMARNAALREEAETGEKITNARRRELEVQYEQADVAGRSRESEMDIGDELERQKRLREEAVRIADAAIKEAERDPVRPGRKHGVRDTYASINDEAAEAVDAENTDYTTKIGALKTSGKDTAENAAKVYEHHQRELTKIKAEAEQRRHELTLQYVDAGKEALGNAAEFAQSKGKEGFAAYKALTIAQTLISTIESAQNAFNSLSNIPYVGVPLGIAAAAAATAAGMARVATIRAQTYSGGREHGGAVSGGAMYEVGERGKPEIFEQNGRLYMIPGNSGTVKPAQAISGQATYAAPQVQIVNNGHPIDVRSESWDGQTMRLVIDSAIAGSQAAAIRDARDNGPVTQTSNARTGVRRRPVFAGAR
jgi:tape measure domain-containing protein